MNIILNQLNITTPAYHSNTFEAMSNLTPGRQSPFRRQPSTNSPTPLRASTPTTSPAKPSLFSPARGGSLPPEKSSPSVRNTRDEAISGQVGNAHRREGSLSPTKDDDRNVYTLRMERQAETSVKRSQVELGSPALTDIDVFGSPTTPILQNTKPVHENTKIHQPIFNVASTKSTLASRGVATYNNIPAPLLRSFRESFEVLDPNATGTLNPTSLQPVLDQLGLPYEAAFFSGKSTSMNLATYLDTLSAQFSQLSSPEELAAAFGAFDVDDSGQIDVQDLRHAVLRTMPEPGEVNQGARLTEKEVDTVLQSFTGRRAFGSKVASNQKTRGEVFKWRDFVHNVNGGVDSRADVVAV